jgi:hypothetical protein
LLTLFDPLRICTTCLGGCMYNSANAGVLFAIRYPSASEGKTAGRDPEQRPSSHSRENNGAYHFPVHRIIQAPAFAYGIVSDHFVSRLWSRTGGTNAAQRLLALYARSRPRTGRWTRDSHCRMGAGSCMAWWLYCPAGSCDQQTGVASGPSDRLLPVS